jgi:hypothetical protein
MASVVLATVAGLSFIISLMILLESRKSRRIDYASARLKGLYFLINENKRDLFLGKEPPAVAFIEIRRLSYQAGPKLGRFLHPFIKAANDLKGGPTQSYKIDLENRMFLLGQNIIRASDEEFDDILRELQKLTGTWEGEGGFVKSERKEDEC